MEDKNLNQPEDAVQEETVSTDLSEETAEPAVAEAEENQTETVEAEVNGGEKPKKKKGRIAWVALLVNIAILVVLLLAGTLLIQPQTTGMLIGAAVYFVLSTVLKTIFLRYQRKGMKLAQARKFVEAEAEFEKSFEYFKAHPAIDKYRAVTMLDYSSFCYGEIALVNAGACCTMRGDYDGARDWYRKAIEEFPDGVSGAEALEKLENRVKQEEAAKADAVPVTDEEGNELARPSGFSKYDD